MSNDAIIAELNRWSNEDAHLKYPAFGCQYYDKCNVSVGNSLCEGKYCSMSYVGRDYGADGAYRLVVVGIDHADAEADSFMTRRLGIEKWYQKGGCKFDEHYKGVVRTAAAVLGSGCLSACTNKCQKSLDPSLVCVIDRIAQPNMVKCVRGDVTNRTSKASAEMRINCANHLVAELKILRPELVVFHGVKARWPVLRAIQTNDLTSIGSVNDSHGLSVLYDWPALGARLLFLNHPSHGWLEKQWDKVVVPALIYLRDKGLIPG